MLRHPLAQAISLCLLLPVSQQLLAEEIEEIIVTGQKFERSLQDTPASVVVLNDAVLEDQGIRDFQEIMERTANIHGQPSQGFNIRGIDAFSVSGGGNSYLTSVYIDSAVMPYRVIQQGAFSTWDLQQVEVLRGPQSTLQGRNALAGAIIMNSKQPQYEWDANMRITAGQDGQRELALAGGGAIIEDELAFRIAAEQKEHDGVNYNTTRQQGSDYHDSKHLRAKLLWEPSALPEFKANLAYHFIDSEDGPPWVNQHPVDITIAPYDARTVNYNDPVAEYTETHIGTLTLDYELNDAWSAKSITAYSDAYYGYDWDGDAGPLSASVLNDNRNTDTFSQEFRLSFEYDNFSGVIGAYYSDLEMTDVTRGTQFFTFQALGVRPTLVQLLTAQGVPGATAVADLVLSQYVNADPVELDRNSDFAQSVSTAAVFVDARYKINEQWEIFGGFRWDHETQENASITDINISNADQLPNPANYVQQSPQLAGIIQLLNGYLFQLADQASGTEPPAEADFSELLPKLGLSYHFSDDISASFTYQKGYRSGGVGTNIGRNLVVTYEPEFTDNYELSLRSQWLQRRLTLNANLFYLDWSDQQLDVQLSSNRFDSETRNAGSSEVKGFELEASFEVDQSLSLYAALGWADTEFTDFVITIPGEPDRDLGGRPFTGAPEWTANLGMTYRANGFMLNANANYAGESKTSSNPWAAANPGDPAFDPVNDKRWLLNMRTGYEWDRFGVYLQATNLLDEEYVQLNTQGYGSITLGQPRQLSASFEMRL
ncbi:MAG: TonB-dependent receptor [Cellvibrionaceae bacterium]|nr:TonB-dependent receptor [Cellvibrionaceae bacterium]